MPISFFRSPQTGYLLYSPLSSHDHIQFTADDPVTTSQSVLRAAAFTARCDEFERERGELFLARRVAGLDAELKQVARTLQILNDSGA